MRELTDLADAGGGAGDEHDLAAEVLAGGEWPDQQPVDEAAEEGDGEVDDEHQRQPHVHEAAQEPVGQGLPRHAGRPRLALPLLVAPPVILRQAKTFAGSISGTGRDEELCGPVCACIYACMAPAGCVCACGLWRRGIELMGGWGSLAARPVYTEPYV